MFKPPCLFQLLIVSSILAAGTARAEEDRSMLQMATCQESWLDFKQDPVKVQKYFAPFETQYRRSDDGSFEPLKASTLLGQKISRVYPQSVGMGLGYSVIVEAGFEATKKMVEKQVGKSFAHCAEEEGAKSCELVIGDKKTIVLMEGSRGKNPRSLFGCYYYYEK